MEVCDGLQRNRRVERDVGRARRLFRGLELLRQRFDREHGGDGQAWIALLEPLTVPPSSLVRLPWAAPIAAAVVAGFGWFTLERSNVGPRATNELGSVFRIAIAEDVSGDVSVRELTARR